MSLHPQATYPVPEDTRRVARAAFSHGNVYIQVADHLGNIYNDAQFTCGAQKFSPYDAGRHPA